MGYAAAVVIVVVIICKLIKEARINSKYDKWWERHDRIKDEIIKEYTLDGHEDFLLQQIIPQKAWIYRMKDTSTLQDPLEKELAELDKEAKELNLYSSFSEEGIGKTLYNMYLAKRGKVSSYNVHFGDYEGSLSKKFIKYLESTLHKQGVNLVYIKKPESNDCRWWKAGEEEWF